MHDITEGGTQGWRSACQALLLYWYLATLSIDLTSSSMEMIFLHLHIQRTHFVCRGPSCRRDGLHILPKLFPFSQIPMWNPLWIQSRSRPNRGQRDKKAMSNRNVDRAEAKQE